MPPCCPAGRTPAQLAAKSGHTQLSAHLHAVCAGTTARPAAEPYLERAVLLDAALQDYTDKLEAALQAMQAQQGRCDGSKTSRLYVASTAQGVEDAFQMLLPALLKSATAAAWAPASQPDPVKLSHSSKESKAKDSQVAAECLEMSVVPGMPSESVLGIQAPQEVPPVSTSTSSKLSDDPPAQAPPQPAPAGQERPAASTKTVLQACHAGGPSLCGLVNATAAVAGDDAGQHSPTCSASGVHAASTMQDSSSSTVAGKGPTPAAANLRSMQAAKAAQETKQLPTRPGLAALQPWLADSRLRGWDGEGSQGTQLVATVPYCRPLACLTQVTSL
jgi:hypothetical protein